MSVQPAGDGTGYGLWSAQVFAHALYKPPWPFCLYAPDYAIWLFVEPVFAAPDDAARLQYVDKLHVSYLWVLQQSV